MPNRRNGSTPPGARPPFEEGPHKRNGNGAASAAKRAGGNGSAGFPLAADAGSGSAKHANGTTAPKRALYNCQKCPGYCCSYPIITVSRRDLERLARHFGLPPEVAEKRFTKSDHGYKRIMRRKPDQHFGMICRFFDTEKRCCTIYHARPKICREFPGEGRCGYYDFLSFERRAQEDPEFIARTNHG